jgi:hypothetical protein
MEQDTHDLQEPPHPEPPDDVEFHDPPTELLRHILDGLRRMP